MSIVSKRNYFMRKGNHMKLEWLGRYREMVQYLMRFSNRYSAIKTKEAMGDDIPYSFEQIQVIEYLLENETMSGEDFDYFCEHGEMPPHTETKTEAPAEEETEQKDEAPDISQEETEE